MQESVTGKHREKPKRRRWRGLAAVALVLAPAHAFALVPVLAPAPETSFVEDLFSWSKYKIRVGPGALYSPDYEGSSRYRLHFVPVVDLQWKQLASIHEKSLRIYLVHKPWLRLGPIVSYASGRRESDNPHLRGLGDVGIGMEVGGFAESVVGPVAVRLDMQKEVVGGHGGWISHVEVGSVFFENETWSLAAGARMSIAGQNYMNSFFGITPAQSAASGLPAFHAGSGVKDIGVGLLTNYAINDSWALGSVLGCARLRGDAAKSPLVKDVGSANQCIAFFRLTYQL